MLVVEHDPDVIQTADHVIDIGPNAGKDGGEIMFEGTYDGLLQSQTSTGKALNKRHNLKENPRTTSEMFHIKDISRNNLNHISTQLPKQAMTVVTGVAGSGKSSLISAAFEHDDCAIFIDQKPPHASNRSNLLTYLNIFDDVRSFFSQHTGMKKHV